MALSADLGTALALAINAGGLGFGGAIGKTGSSYHVEYGDQPKRWPAGATGRCLVRDGALEIVESFKGSARTRYGFELWFELTDVRGKKSALALVRNGLEKVLADKGLGVFAHFTDTGAPANRLPGTGEWELSDLNVLQPDSGQDQDRPTVMANVTCELWHVSPTT